MICRGYDLTVTLDFVFRPQACIDTVVLHQLERRGAIIKKYINVKFGIALLLRKLISISYSS